MIAFKKLLFRCLRLQLSGLILLFSLPVYSSDTMLVALADDSELQVQRYAAEGDSLLIILPSEHGITEGLQTLAENLSQSGIEVWIADPFSTWFLPTVASSLKEIPVSAYVQLISHAEKTARHIYLLSNDKGAAVLLEAVHQWQSDEPGILSGVILISPELYVKTPSPGNNGQFLPIAEATNLPLFIYVPAKSTLALRINDLRNVLEKGGSDVYLQVLPELRNRFFFRADATDTEQKAGDTLAQKIQHSMQLTRTFAGPRTPPVLTQSSNRNNTRTAGLLRPYHGDLSAEEFILKDISGTLHSLSQYQGRVLIVNFWASWCPPCVHEMPSMTRLNNDLIRQPFTILAVNLGEELEDIRHFLTTYPVSFPILLDPQQKLTRKWKVFAFPTSYVLDRQGNIRYSVAGGIDWGSAEVRHTINALINE